MKNRCSQFAKRIPALLAVMMLIVLSFSSNAQCKLLNENFTTSPVLSPTNVDGAWYPDRYRPAGFVADAGRLKISISASDGAQLRPSGFSAGFYNTQGRKINQCGKCVTVAKADIYIPADWATKHRRTDMWATTFTSADAVLDFPIIGFANVDGVSPTLRYWDGGIGWVNVAGLAYDTWITLEMSLAGGNIVYKVNGTTVGTVASATSVYMGNVIMQAFNFNDNTLGAAYDNTVDNSYDAYWDNLITTGTGGKVVTNTNTGETFCTIQGAIDDAETLNGHTITVSTGTYNEMVTVNKSLTINGANSGIAGNGGRGAESIIDGNNGTHPGFVITANGVTIDGFKVQNCGAGIYESGIYTNASGSQIKNNILFNNEKGVYASNSGASMVQYNLFDGNNRTGSAGQVGLYSFTSNGLSVLNNEFKNQTDNAAVLFDGGASHQNLIFNSNYLHDNDPGSSAIYAVNIAGGEFANNNITNGKRGIKIAGGNSLINIHNNIITGTVQADVMINTDFSPSNTGIQVHNNSLTGSTAILNEETTVVNATCNWYGNISGPATASNPGGTGSIISGTGGKTFANWLYYGTDANAAIGLQLPGAITVTAAANTSAAVNNYRLLSNAIGCLVDNQTLTMSGNFNFSNFTANAAWALGNDGVGGNGDDYSIVAPPDVNGVTITAASLGAATVTGVGDIPTVNLEGFLVFNGGDNKNWTISKLQIMDFDLSVGMFSGAGGTDAFDGLNFINNKIKIPLDLNTVVAPADVNQNIGLHYSFGKNQTIANNIFEVEGDGQSSGSSYSTSIVMQSNTSGGAFYDGLKIKDNTITVLNNPDPANPAVIRGIWENGHNTDAAIEISGNVFSNASGGNTANLNRQNAFWVTSRSGAVKKVEYKNNEVTGFKEGLAWLGGLYTGNTPPLYETGAFPVLVKNNKFDAVLNAVTVRKDGASTNAGSPGYTQNNSFTNIISGGFAIKNEGTGDAQSVCNWYGSASIAAANALNSGPVYLASILNSGVDGSAATGFQPTGTCIVPPVHNVTQDIYYTLIQPAVNGANNGDSITVSSGTYDEQVLVNKSVKLQGIGASKPIVNFTGTAAVTARPAIFDVTMPDVTIRDFDFRVNLTKIGSAILASAANISNLVVDSNEIRPYRTAGLLAFSLRNAISLNYAGLRVSNSNPVNISGTRNVVYYSDNGTPGDPTDDAGFRSGFDMDEATGLFDDNTIQSISQDIQARFANIGNLTISNNKINGGGVEIAEQNGGSGTFMVTGNTFNGAFSNTYSSSLRLKNNYTARPTSVSNNIFNNHNAGISLENYQTVTVDNNTFTPIAASTSYIHIAVNTKEFSSSSGVVQPAISGNFTNNTFNGSGTTGGKALAFYNQDNDSPVFGTFTIGTPGNENNFAAGIATFIYLDNQTGTTNPNATPTVPFGVNLNAINNKFDVSGSLQLPSAMTLTSLFALENKIDHAIDLSALGFVTVKSNNTFVTPASFVSPNTAAAVQRGVDAAGAGFIVNVADGTYIGDVNVNKSITLDGESRAGTILKGLYVTGIGATINLGNTSADNSVVKDLTVSRDYQDWYNSTKNYGVKLSGGVNNVTLQNLLVTDNRTGVYVENNSQLNMTNSTIEKNRTGLFITNTVRGLVTNNIIRANQTHGVYYDLSDGTSNLTGFQIHDNSISGNWFSQVTFRGTNSLAPQANFECNWWGTNAPVVNATNPSETGYAGLMPQQLGGTSAQATYAGEFRGNGAIYIDFNPWRTGEAGNTSDPFVPTGTCNGTPIVIASAVADSITCGETSGSILVTFSGGTGPYNITWTGGSATGVSSPYNISPLNAGTYTITVTDA
ncbi:MAG: right-handed parallel beta-helix repeat-containing protein, partial [Chitinophagaceae bacterium]